MKIIDKSRDTEYISNFGFTEKRQFLVYLPGNVYIEDNKIVFDNKTKIENFKNFYNYYEHYNENHIYNDFKNLLKNKKINDEDICNFIKKYGYLFYDEKIKTLSNNTILDIDWFQPKFYLPPYYIKKKKFTDELFIFNNILQLHNLISTYEQLKDTVIPPLKKWSITKKRILTYLEYYNIDQAQINAYEKYFDLGHNFKFSKSFLDTIKDYYTILLNYHLKNSGVKILEHKSEFISVTEPRNLIEVIYLDYFNYIKDKKTKICKQCGNIFHVSSKNNKKLYCSTPCKNKYHSIKSNNKPQNKIKIYYYKKLYDSDYDKFTDDYLEKAGKLCAEYENKKIKSIENYKKEIIKLYNSYISQEVE